MSRGGDSSRQQPQPRGHGEAPRRHAGPPTPVMARLQVQIALRVCSASSLIIALTPVRGRLAHADGGRGRAALAHGDEQLRGFGLENAVDLVKALYAPSSETSIDTTRTGPSFVKRTLFSFACPTMSPIVNG
eukprot:tig00021017_g17220.t1